MPDTKCGKFAAGPINPHKPPNLALQAEPKGKPATLTSKPVMSSCIRWVKPQFTCRGAAKVSPHPAHGHLSWHHTGVNPLGVTHLFPIPGKVLFCSCKRCLDRKHCLAFQTKHTVHGLAPKSASPSFLVPMSKTKKTSILGLPRVIFLHFPF